MKYSADISSKQQYSTNLSSVAPYGININSKQRYTALVLEWVNSAISFKSYSSISTDYTITYTGNDTPQWTDGTNELTGTSVTFPWTDTTVKHVHLYVQNPELVRADFWSDTTIFELNISRVPTDSTSIDLSNASLRRFYTPINSALTSIESQLGIEVIEVLNCAASTFTDIDLALWRCFNLYSFVQPRKAWSATRLQITNSVIYETLNLSNLTLNGSLSIVDNPFIEEITFNSDVDYSSCTSFKIDNSTLLNYIDFSIMSGLLSPNDSAITVLDIGASQSQVDEMLHQLSLIIPNNSATGRQVRLSGTPSSQGLIYKAAIEALGVTVYTD